MRVLLLLLSMLGLLACDGSITLVVVRVDSALTVPDELDEIVVEVAERSARATLGGPDDAPLPRTVELRAGDGLGPYTVVARGYMNGTEVARASREVMFVAGETVEVSLTLSDAPPPDGGLDAGADEDGGVDAGVRDAGAPTDGCLAEACNALDDDCDGDIDEDGACAPCVRTVFRGHVYQLCDAPMSQAGARGRCMDGGYDLVSFDDAVENEHIVSEGMSMMALTDVPWIGLQRRGGSTSFDWLDGSSSSYRNWDTEAGEPRREPDCVLLRPDGTWRTASCELPQPFICEAAP